MNWWEEAEARARRSKSPASLALTLQQRFSAAGLDMDLAHAPTYDLAQLYNLCADLILLVEGLLLVADGDLTAMRRHAQALLRWAESARFWAESSAPSFNQLLDGLDLDADALLQREAMEEQSSAGLPEEQAKIDGRYRFWHLLFERLDLKLASAGLPETVHRALARSLSRFYEESLVTIRVINGIEKDASPRYRAIARLLLGLNTTWHFDLGPLHLGYGRIKAKGGAALGLPTLLLLGFGNNSGNGVSQP